MKFPGPKPLAQEHEALHGELAKALKAGGQTAAAAEVLVKIMHGHFVKEDELAMPPLGLLPQLARGQVPARMKNILPLTDKLREELPVFLKEHRAILAAVKKLGAAAQREGKPVQVQLTNKLKAHIAVEEQVLYPAAILIGDYLKLRNCPWVH